MLAEDGGQRLDPRHRLLPVRRIQLRIVPVQREMEPVRRVGFPLRAAGEGPNRGPPELLRPNDATDFEGWRGAGVG